MSDALSDIAREQQRGAAFERYLDAIIAYITKPTKTNQENVFKAAKETDSVVGGYFHSEPTKLSEGLGKRLTRLRKNDEEAWVTLLSSVMEEAAYFSKLKKLSPFKDQIAIILKYQYNNLIMGGDFHRYAIWHGPLTKDAPKDVRGKNVFIVFPAPSKRKIKFIPL